MTAPLPAPSNVPARHRAVLVSERGAPEYVDLGPTEPAPEVLTRDGVRWLCAGCSDGVACTAIRGMA